MADEPIAEIEEWRAIPGQPGYEVSNLGRVRSLDRLVVTKDGRVVASCGAVLEPYRAAIYLAVGLPRNQAKTVQPPPWWTSPFPLIIQPVRMDDRGTWRSLQKIHILVCTAFHGPRPARGSEAAHIDGNKHNNRAENLRWSTKSNNTLDRIRHGTLAFGEQHHNAKLIEADVREIRNLCAAYPDRITAIAKQFGISPATVYGIRKRETWKYVSETSDPSGTAEEPSGETEAWRPVPGHPQYEVSSLGRVRSLDRWITYKDGRRPRFWHGVVFQSNPAARYHALRLGCNSPMTYAHVIVCEVFNGPRPSKEHQVAHWNGNTHDNRATNLRWATPKENRADDPRNGASRNGSDNGWAKLTENDIRTIRKMRAAGATLAAIGDRFGIVKSHVSRIIRGENWGHVA